MPVDDPVHRRKAHAASLPDLLCREEGVEHALLHVRRDAGARIGYGELDEFAGQASPAARADRRRPGASKRHADCTACTHRVACIDRQVHQHLLELDRIDQNRGRVVIELDGERDR